MQVYRDIESLPYIDSSVVTVGSFDGVHLAHQALLQRVVELCEVSSASGFVVTFEPHPRVALGKADGLKLLTSTDEKIEILASLGVDNLLILPFTSELSRLDYSTFIRSILLGKLSMREMVVGFNHRLGSDSGNSSAIESMQESFAVNVVERIDSHHEKISSTHVRELLFRGDFNRAVELLNHPYLICGDVLSGEVVVSDNYKLVPQEGVYRGTVDGESVDLMVTSNRVRRADSVAIVNPKVSLTYYYV